MLALEDLLDLEMRQRLINQNILNNMISEEEYVEEYFPNEITRGMMDKILANMSDSEYIGSLSQSRLALIPHFKLSDIRGSFDYDEQGFKIMLMKKEEGDLIDRCGSKVNKLGYLIDQTGNIVSSHGAMIFKRSELVSEGELPEPFYSTLCIAKHKKSSSQFKIMDYKSSSSNRWT